MLREDKQGEGKATVPLSWPCMAHMWDGSKQGKGGGGRWTTMDAVLLTPPGRSLQEPRLTYLLIHVPARLLSD